MMKQKMGAHDWTKENLNLNQRLNEMFNKTQNTWCRYLPKQYSCYAILTLSFMNIHVKLHPLWIIIEVQFHVYA